MTEDQVTQAVYAEMATLIHDGRVDYAALWVFLNQGTEQIWADDTVWWNAMAAALNVTIVIHDADIGGRLREIVRYNNGHDVVHVFGRGAHYTAMVPLDEAASDQIRAIIDLNRDYIPMF
ncbi:MAG: hypothetical protein LBT70_04355 [Holosporaceae bacterium]|jgi:hypothetical protein|nr:hypothetical protein [Holosporaceae bacterium]